MASNAPPGGHEAHGGTGEFSFNITNLHTHGLHTSPSGQGDNVLVEVAPGKSREYLIKIPANHPAGLFWYHAHFHGSTAVQLSSGMAGALVIEGGSDARGGLDSIPEIKAAKEHILVLQQLRYGPDGQLEEFDTPFGKGQWTRGITVNGLFVPTISMRPGEVQRWRIVHAGVADNINLSLDGHKLNEIATDGIALGRLVSWPGATPTNPTNSLVLGPGYRTDVLVQAAPLQNGETSHEYYLRDGPLPPHLSLQSAFEAFSEARQSQADVNTLAVRNAMGSIPGKPSRVIARIVVQGSPLQMALPSSAALADRVPTSLRPIQDGDITGTAQTVSLQVDQRRCAADGSCEADACTKDSAGCMERYMVNNRLFNMGHTRTLKLGQAAEWKLQSLDVFAHPFHIHVNPFQLTRLEPDATGKMVSGVVWKDTVSLPTDQSVLTVRTRYADFTGRFVLHCHILPHEDMGMMELVEIVP
jgi:FtsP/CotA-like multicopper oxidase with cupredoxin domain